MNPSKNWHKNNALNYGYIFAERMYEDFSKEENRGPNFSWDNFPDMAARFAKSHFSLDFPVKSDSMELQELCAQSATERAKELIKNNE